MSKSEIIVLVVIFLAIVLVLIYSCCVMSGRADRDAEYWSQRNKERENAEKEVKKDITVITNNSAEEAGTHIAMAVKQEEHN